MTRACNHHLWSVRQVVRPAQTRIVDHHPGLSAIRHPSSASGQPACAMGIGIGRPTGVETTFRPPFHFHCPDRTPSWHTAGCSVLARH